ncbi:MAG TPA: hypothetical protein VIG97_08260 [Luteimonas sp.]
MQRYAGGDASGVAAYAYGPGWIDLHFHHGGAYRYDGTRPGAEHVLEMQRLADLGQGLNTYVNRYVRDNYARRLG